MKRYSGQSPIQKWHVTPGSGLRDTDWSAKRTVDTITVSGKNVNHANILRMSELIY